MNEGRDRVKDPRITAIRRSLVRPEFDLLVHGVDRTCYSPLLEFTADVRGFLKCLTPCRWVSYSTLVGLSNGDVLIGGKALTASSGSSGVSLSRLHLISERGQIFGWLYGSSRAPGSPWWMVNALTSSFTVVAGPDKGAHNFSNYAVMPRGKYCPKEVGELANYLLHYYLVLLHRLSLDKRLGRQRCHHHMVFPLVWRPSQAVPVGLRLSPPFAVPLTRFSCVLPCGLAAVFNLNALRYYSTAEALVNLWQTGESAVRDVTCLRNLGNKLTSLRPRMEEEYVPHRFSRAVPVDLRSGGIVAARGRLSWVLENNSGPLGVVLLDREGSVSHAVAVVDDLYGRRVILDHEVAEALPLSRGAFEVCCGERKSIERLAEVVLVRAVGRKAHDRDERSVWGMPPELMAGNGTGPVDYTPVGRRGRKRRRRR